MTTPDDHTLNACLARVIGLKWGFNTGTLQLGYFEGDTLKYAQNEWNPVRNANQMEEVEAWLIKEKYCWTLDRRFDDFFVRLFTSSRKEGSMNNWDAYDPDKKRALALAIWELEQSQKDQHAR